MGWPGEAAALLQDCLLRLLSMTLSGRETSLVVAGESCVVCPISSLAIEQAQRRLAMCCRRIKTR